MAAERFGSERGIEQLQSESAMLFGNENSRHAELDESLQHVDRVSFLSRSFAHALEWTDALERAVDALLHHLLVVAEREFHCLSLRRFGFARHAQATLGDNVLLDLRRAAADDQTEIEHVARLPVAAVA